jgi:predicted transposase YbfD/YdcC
MARSSARERGYDGQWEKAKAAFLALPENQFEAERTGTDGKTTQAVRYVALSKVFTAPKLAEVVRTYWTIENQLHWTLDVVFHEDDARTRKDNGPQNLAFPPQAGTEHLARPSTRHIHGKKNAKSRLGQRILLRTLCLYAIALRQSRGVSR